MTRPERRPQLVRTTVPDDPLGGVVDDPGDIHPSQGRAATPPRAADLPVAQPMITVTTRLALDVKTAVDQYKQATGETLQDLFDRLLREELGLPERKR